MNRSTAVVGSVLCLLGGMGLMFVPITLTVVSKVAPQEAGVASSGINIGQQVGGAIGLAAIGTIAWGGVAHSVTNQLAAASGAAAGGASAASAAASGGGFTGQLPTTVANTALTSGFSTALEVTSAVVFLAFFVAFFATWTGRFRLRSAVTAGREQPCDEVLGTCEM